MNCEGLLSSSVINEHSLHIFACKLFQRTSDFLDVPPVHLRRVHKTGLPVSLDLEGHGLATRGFLHPTVNHFHSPNRGQVLDIIASRKAVMPAQWNYVQGTTYALTRTSALTKPDSRPLESQL